MTIVEVDRATATEFFARGGDIHLAIAGYSMGPVATVSTRSYTTLGRGIARCRVVNTGKVLTCIDADDPHPDNPVSRIPGSGGRGFAIATTD